MGYKFSERSKQNLSQCHPDLQKIALAVLEIHDCTVIEGHRPKEEQDKAFHSGKSKLKWPESKHNKKPSEAIDLVPYPIDWNDKNRFYYFAGLVMGTAHSLGINLRWGGDWDGDNSFKDQNFHDLPHFERVVEDDNS